MATDQAKGSDTTRVWPVVVTAILFVLLMLTSGLLGFCGWMTYTDTYRPESRWGVVGMGVGGLLFVTSVASILSLIVRKPAAWFAAVGLMGLSVLVIGVLIWASLDLLASSRHRGGDWAALSGLGDLVLGVICPAFVSTLTLAGAGCLWALRRRLKERAS